MTERVRVVEAPALVLGAGVAGLAAALALAAGSGAVVVADEVPGQGGSSPWAQGGVAAAVGPNDTPAAHAADTIAAGGGLVDEVMAGLIVSEGPEMVSWLERAGARFDRRPDGTLALGREAAHGLHRIVHAKDATGAELVRALYGAALPAPGVQVVTGQIAIDLLCRGNRVVGVLCRQRDDGELVAWLAPAVVLATGGYAHLWAVTTTPPQAVGDGLAMAARAGAALADLEFVQFHPTALAGAADPAPLLTEALRGEGAVLVDDAGERFCLSAHPDGELAPRDVVARAIYRHLEAGHGAFLDARSAVGERFPERFPTVFRQCQRAGLDPRVEVLPVSPAAHYCMGGVITDSRGRTTLLGLWAAGEVTATGLHGANRLASNSLLEGIVMGRRVGADIVRAAPASFARRPARLDGVAAPLGAGSLGEDDGANVVQATRRLLWDGAGVARTVDGLTRAAREAARLAVLARDTASRPAANATLVAQLVVEAALARRESRGAHFLADRPSADPAQARRRTIRPHPAMTELLALGATVPA